MPISDYTITPWVDLSVNPTGTPDLDAGSLLKIETRLYDLTEAMQSLQVNFEDASDLLTFLETVDGAGSGLDADLLDGTQLSAIQIRSERGAANGYPELDVNGLVPEDQLPAPPGSDVTSVFSRTGAITAASGDYTASQITNTPAGTIAATNVQAALNELDSEKQATSAKNAASGYAGLDASTLLDKAQMATGTPSIQNFMRGDGTWATSVHTCTSGTHPSSPYKGMIIYETDNDVLLVNRGTTGSPLWQGLVMLTIPFADGRQTGSIATGDIPLRFQAEYNITIIGVRANLYQTGSTSTIGDLKRATVASPGTLSTLYTSNTKPTITSGNYGSGAAALPNVVNIDAGEWLVGNINTLGTGAGGFTLQVAYVRRG